MEILRVTGIAGYRCSPTRPLRSSRGIVASPTRVTIDTWTGLIAALLLVVLNAFFVALEFSLVAVDRSEVDVAVDTGDRRAVAVSSALRRSSFYLSGVQLGITFCSVLLGFVAEPSVAHLLRPVLGSIVGADRSTTVSTVLALLLATVVQMLLGELVPKMIAVARPFRTARALAPAGRFYTAVFRPLIVVFSGAANALVRLVGIEPREEFSQVRSRHELVRLVQSSGEEGVLGAEEARLLSKAFDFPSKTAADSMTPRTEMRGLASDGHGAALRLASIETGLSRFPVVGADADDIVGVVDVKLLFGLAPEDRDEVPLVELMDEPMVVPESLPLDRLMFEMRERGVSLAVVLDEYGGTAGIISLEDVLEEIVGDIEDEHDQSPQRALAWRWGESWVMSGRLHPDEVRDHCGFVIPDGEYETLAGFVLARLGRIPAAGDHFLLDGWRIEVLEMDRHRVSMVRIEAPEAPSEVST